MLKTRSLPGQIRFVIPGFAFAALFTLYSATAVGQDVAVTHCKGSCPQYDSVLTANTSKVVIHHLYAAGLNEYSRRADWVAYRLSKEAVGIASLLPREWNPDSLAKFSEVAEAADLQNDDALPDIRSSVSPYGGIAEPVSNEQARVRLAPMTSFANTPYWSELNSTSNMLPMPAPLRLGAWLRLEQSLNALVVADQELHVVAGPLYFNGEAPGSDSLVPGMNLMGYFKIVMRDSGYASFVFPHNMRQHESFCGHAAALNEIERLTGLEMFPGRSLAQSQPLIADLGCSD